MMNENNQAISSYDYDKMFSNNLKNNELEFTPTLGAQLSIVVA
jgi:hypothetical protein